LFLLIPWKVDVPEDRLPLTNWLIIGVIVGFFVWQMQQVNLYHTTIEDELSLLANNSFQIKTDIFKGLVLKDWDIRGLLGHMWLHAGKVHLFGNLFFLWIFGNSVCAKIGQIKFGILYLIFGLAAGACQLLVCKNPSLGASGAIYGVMGMYLVFFPTNEISTLYIWLFPVYVKPIEISGLIFVFVRVAFDIIGAIFGLGNTAYFAHIGGFVTGMIMASLLILTGLVKMSSDEISIYKLFAPKPKPQLKRSLYERILTRDYSNSDDIQPSAQPSAYSASGENFIHLQCKCGMRCKIPAKYAGKTGKCPRCRQPVLIPLA
jgi:membrane associated rhomboid family serine protease